MVSIGQTSFKNLAFAFRGVFLFVVTVACFAPQDLRANSNVQCLSQVTSRADVRVSDRLKSEVLRLEAELQRELRSTEDAAARVADMKAQIQDLRRQMSWAEKNLWRWLVGLLGGDISKFDELKSRQENARHLSSLLEQDRRGDKSADAAVLKQIEEWLIENDRHYASLKSVEQKLNRAVCDGNSCLRVINQAIESVNHATSMEAIDAFSKNGGISVLSTFATSDANGAATEARNAAKQYLDAARAIQSSIAQDLNQVRSVDDTVDLVVDLVFDFNFDFVSVVNLFALDGLNGDLRQMRGQIQRVRDAFQREHQDLKSRLVQTVCRVREICATR